MNPIVQYFLYRKAREKIERKSGGGWPQRQIYEELTKLKATVKHLLKDVLFIALGIASAGFGLKGFLLPSSFIDGGVTGISLLTREITGYPLSVLLVIINLPFLILGLNVLGRQFVFRSVAAIIGLALTVHFFDYTVITTDKLLVAAFGGFFLGAGIGLAVRGGAVLDGTEILAIFISRRSGATIGDVILVFNIIIFSFGAYILSFEIALYAILTYFAASKTVDFVIEGIEEYTGITIISDKSEDLRLMITDKLGRGCTIYNGKRGFTKKRGEMPRDTEIIYTVLTRLEIAKLQTEIDKIDPQAFVIMSSIKDTKGGMIKRRPLKN